MQISVMTSVYLREGGVQPKLVIAILVQKISWVEVKNKSMSEISTLIKVPTELK